MTRTLVSRFEQLLQLSVLVLLSLGVSPAPAQFICVGNVNGATVGDGVAGTTASGDGAIGLTGNTGNLACGTNANGGGMSSKNTAVGVDADANSFGSIGGGNTAIGNGADASGFSQAHNVAIGDGAAANGGASANIAIGAGHAASGFAPTNASGFNSLNIAIGSGSIASGDATSNVAIGGNASASNNSAALGGGAVATGATSAAFGNAASATFANSAAFGNGATATRANQQVFGTSVNTYTLAGVASSASRAAQSGQTQFVTTDAGGNLAAASAADLGLATTGDLAAINARLNDLDSRTSKALTGVAMAFAMAGVPNLMPNERFAVTANFGTYEGRNGTAFNAAVRISEQAQLTGGVAVGINDSVVGGRVGLRLGW